MHISDNTRPAVSLSKETRQKIADLQDILGEAIGARLSAAYVVRASVERLYKDTAKAIKHDLEAVIRARQG